MARRKTDWLGEGTTPYAEAGVRLSELEGYFDSVTDAHRAKARAYFAKIEGKRQPRQADLFGQAA